MPKIARRQFIERTGALAAAYTLDRNLATRLVANGSARGSAALAPDRPASALSGPSMAISPLLSVAVCQGTNADSAGALLKTALDALGGIGRFVRPGQVVAIKPNATWDYPPGTASSTDPDLLEALIVLVREAGAKRIIVMDHPTLSAAAQCLQISGIGAVLDRLGVEKVFPDGYVAGKEYCTTISLPKGKAYQSIGVLKAAVEADVRINMAVAKSHVVLPVTLCLKHMMGFLENPPALHAQLEQGITDINQESAIQAQLHILEAIRVRLPTGTAKMAAGKDNEITNPKRVKRLNQVLAGTDPVLIDSYACANYFGYQPREIRYIRTAGEQGLGEMDVKQATDEGRLRVVRAGQPIQAPAPTATPMPTGAAGTGPAGAGTATPQRANLQATATNTPLPTETPEPVTMASCTQPAIQPGIQASSVTVINPNRVLSGALAPAAAILAGVTVVLGRRLSRHEQKTATTLGDVAPDPDVAPVPAASEPDAADSGQPDLSVGTGDSDDCSAP